MTITPFGKQVEKPDYSKKNLKKTKFLDLNSSVTVRLLSNDYYSENTHYINGATVKCLGEDCPVCANNKVIRMQNPDTYRDDPRYVYRGTRYMVNVLDRTPVRVCPNCSTENKVTSAGSPSTACSGCGNILTGTPQPSNQVKVLSRGVTLFEHLGSIYSSILDSNGEPVGLTGYDITLAVTGTGKEKNITPIPGQVSQLDVDIPEEELYDLSKVVIELSPTEMLDLQRGVSLRDIFSARKVSKEADVADNFISQDVLNSAKSEVDALFRV